MRGAALKLGQFMSIQGLFIAYEQISCLNVASKLIIVFIFGIDTHLLPPEIDKIFRRVQDSAHYMPDWQMKVSSLPLSASSHLTNTSSSSKS
jgi:aarF domain-containing kinase